MRAISIYISTEVVCARNVTVGRAVLPGTIGGEVPNPNSYDRATFG